MMTTRLVGTISQTREVLAEFRKQGASVGFVPTMGSLHAGHGQLIERARRESSCTVVSIFVNPIQFDRKDDYERYPRILDDDMTFCEARGVDVVFAPGAEDMYPLPQHAFVDVTGLDAHLCGRFRPGHFRGMATVVLKLFNIIQPDRAYFGEKDAQQLAIIRRMVDDLNLPVEIVGVPTVREQDGLALSSRNKHLDAKDRLSATTLYRALKTAESCIAGGVVDPESVKEAALVTLQQDPRVRVEYLEIVDPDLMQPVTRITGPVRVAGAVWLGSTRLIDNLLCQASKEI